MVLQLKEGQKGLGNGPVGLGVFSNSDEIWTILRRPPRDLLTVLVASHSVPGSTGGCRDPAVSSLVQRGTASLAPGLGLPLLPTLCMQYQ